MAPPEPIGPFKLVTVNTAPDRAKRLIGRIVEDVKDKYPIVHAANAAGRDTGYAQHIFAAADRPGLAIEDVKATVEAHQPDVLVCLEHCFEYPCTIND
jgi:hypothetical protein